MALALTKLILASSSVNADTAGAYIDAVTVTAAASTTTLVPVGMYLLIPTANVSVQVYNSSAWVTLIAANTGGTLFSDGINVRFNNSSTEATVTLMTVNGGQAATGTYNT